MKAILIKQVKLGDLGGTPIVTEQTTEVSPKDEKDFSLQEMYDLLGCDMVEHVWLAEGVDMWCDEEGLLKDKPLFNSKATEYYRRAYPDVPAKDLAIFGNALIVDNANWL